MSDTIDILGEAAEWCRAGGGVALATVVTTWGSSPRPVGSKLAVNESGRMIGSVSGGCVEGAVVEMALAIIKSGQPKLLEFGVSDEDAWDVGLACGGRVQIFVEKLSSPDLLERILAAAEEGVAAALATNLETGAQRLIVQDKAGAVGDLPLSAQELAQVRQAVNDDRNATIETGAGRVFIEVSNLAPRLLVIGAVHTAQMLVPLARLTGYDVTVIDPRTAFGTAARFPDTTLRHDWPDKALEALKPDRRTAVVTLTHDPKIDDPALRSALNSDAFYIGALGSRRSHAKRTERLAEAGFDAASIARIRGPVGLAIGAITPGEIAISIMSEITAVFRRAPLAQRAG